MPGSNVRHLYGNSSFRNHIAATTFEIAVTDREDTLIEQFKERGNQFGGDLLFGYQATLDIIDACELAGLIVSRIEFFEEDGRFRIPRHILDLPLSIDAPTDHDIVVRVTAQEARDFIAGGFPSNTTLACFVILDDWNPHAKTYLGIP